MARAKLGEILVQRGVLDASALKRALGEQIRFAGQKIRLGQLLVDMRVCTWDQVGSALAEQLDVPYADLGSVDENAAKLVPVEVCEKWRALAFHREVGPPEQVCVAFEDPGDLVAVDALRLRIGKRLKVFIGAPDRIKTAVDRIFRGVEPPVQSEGVALEAELFGDDGGGEMAVEHYDTGSLTLSNAIGLADPPAPKASPDSVIGIDAPVVGPSTAETFDSLFGAAPPPAVQRDLTGAASVAVGLGDPFAGLSRTVSEPLSATTPRAEITRFPDKRAKEPPPPLPKPMLVLTTDALFSSSLSEPTSEPAAEPPSDVLAGEVVAEGDAEPASVDPAHALFGPPLDSLSEQEPAPPLPAQPAAEAVGGVAESPVPDEPESELEIEEIDMAEIGAGDSIASPTIAPVPAAELPPAAPVARAGAPIEAALASFAERPLTDQELAIIEAIDLLADGSIEETPIKQAKPTQMIAALVRLLIRRGVIQETEFLTELSRK